MTPGEMAALHHRASAGTRAWSAEEYTQLSAANHALLLTADHGFVLGQLIGDEAEIFMIIVDPAHQRRGFGLAYLDQFEARAQRRWSPLFFGSCRLKSGGPSAL